MSINLLDVLKVCIICEGEEELDYLNRLIGLGIFSDKYSIKLVNAKGISNIAGVYQNYYSKNLYHIVFVFCDTDKKPYCDYNLLKKKINSIHGTSVSDKVIFFGNPCTMQIFLLHFDLVKVSSNSKKVNSTLIKEITGIENYDGSKEKRNELFSRMYKRTYTKLKENINSIASLDDSIVSSTNFNVLLDYLENDDVNWIEDINRILD